MPEGVLRATGFDEADFGRQLRMLAAVKLFELGRLSSGLAAELAGMGRTEFLLSLKHYEVFPLMDELNLIERQSWRRRLGDG